MGTGHYVFDPGDSCSVHSRRLEAWCNVLDFDVAREELHWHCMTLSQLEGDPENIRSMGRQLIQGRQEKLIAEREMAFESEMAAIEGTMKATPGSVRSEQQEIEQASEREGELRRQAESRSQKVDELRRQFNALPRRARVEIQFRIVLAVSISFTVFDVGVLGSAFELIPGATVWKVILTLGVALAPISVAIGIAQWLSAAELSLREGVKATRLAIVAGALCIIGIGLIVLFRAAATGEPPLPARAYLFLAFIQSALAIAETMIYTVYFDSKVGASMLKRIQAAEDAVAQVDKEAVAEHARARTAQSRIGNIETESERAAAELQRGKKRLGDIRREEEGSAAVLAAVVEHAIQEGVQAARRSRERKAEEARAMAAEARLSPDMRKWIAGGTVTIVLAVIATGSLAL